MKRWRARRVAVFLGVAGVALGMMGWALNFVGVKNVPFFAAASAHAASTNIKISPDGTSSWGSDAPSVWGLTSALPGDEAAGSVWLQATDTAPAPGLGGLVQPGLKVTASYPSSTDTDLVNQNLYITQADFGASSPVAGTPSGTCPNSPPTVYDLAHGCRLTWPIAPPPAGDKFTMKVKFAPPATNDIADKSSGAVTINFDITVADLSTPTPTATPTPPATATATPTVVATATPIPPPAATATRTPVPTQTPSPTPAGTPTPSPTPAGTPTPGLTPPVLVSLNGAAPAQVDGTVHQTTNATGGDIPISIGNVRLPGGGAPTTVIVRGIDYDGTVYLIPMTPRADGTWTTTWHAPPGPSGTQIQFEVVISGPNGDTVENIGTITRVDPSGQVKDAVKGCFIVGAKVTLERFVNGTWVVADVSASEQGVLIMDPALNPEVSAGDGSFGWEVVPGLWRVRAEHAGYDPVTSLEVTVPPPVTDLVLAMNPTGEAGVGCVAATVPPSQPNATPTETPVAPTPAGTQAAASPTVAPAGATTPGPGGGTPEPRGTTEVAGARTPGPGAEAPPPLTSFQTYIVRSGETLSDLAVRFFTSIGTLLQLNPGLDAANLKPGDVIKVPPPQQQVFNGTPVPVRVISIVSSTKDRPVVIQTDVPHLLNEGDLVSIAGNPGYNGTWVVKVIDATHFQIDAQGDGSSGGTVSYFAAIGVPVGAPGGVNPAAPILPNLFHQPNDWVDVAQQLLLLSAGIALVGSLAISLFFWLPGALRRRRCEICDEAIGQGEAYLVEGHAYHEMCLLLNPTAAPVSQRGILL